MATADEKRHVVIVGAGVVGCATAFELVRKGLAVTLIERDGIGAHASGRNAGNLNPLHGASPEQVPTLIEAFRIHAEVRAALRTLGCGDGEVQPVQRLHLAFDAGGLEGLDAVRARSASRPGFDAQRLSADETRRWEPRLAADVLGGVLAKGALSVSGLAFTRALARGARRLGARWLQDAVTGVETTGDRVTAVRTDRTRIDCDEVVLATGPWIAQWRRLLGLDIPVTPLKGELLTVRPEGGPLTCDLTWGATCLYRRGDGDIWIGATTQDCGFDVTPSDAARQELLDGAARILPHIARSRIMSHTAALRPMTASGRPIAEAVGGWSNVHIANGGGAKGLLLSVAIARRIGERLGHHAPVAA